MRGIGKHLDAGKRPGVLLERVRSGWGVLCLVVLMAAPVVVGNSQVPQYNGGLPGVERSASGFPGLPENANPRPDSNRALRDSMNQQGSFKQFKELNAQRLKEMNNETGKLLTLANELKAETNKPGNKETKGSLSVMDLRRVEMIEKLAKSVREKMTASLSGAPNALAP